MTTMVVAVGRTCASEHALACYMVLLVSGKCCLILGFCSHATDKVHKKV